MQAAKKKRKQYYRTKEMICKEIYSKVDNKQKFFREKIGKLFEIKVEITKLLDDYSKEIDTAIRRGHLTMVSPFDTSARGNLHQVLILEKKGIIKPLDADRVKKLTKEELSIMKLLSLAVVPANGNTPEEEIGMILLARARKENKKIF